MLLESQFTIICSLKPFQMKSIICTVARNIWWSRTHRRFFITATKNNFHRLDCFKFIQKMRRNLVERNSKANLDEMVVERPSDCLDTLPLGLTLSALSER